MAATGFTPISLYYSATGAAVPTAGNLVAGELALNTNDGKLYFKNSSGVVTLLAGSTSGPAGGSTTQVQYNNAGVLAGITGATSNGTALTLVAPVLGTPASATLTNATGLPISTGVSGLGTGIATALAVNVGTAGSPVVNGGALGTPSSGTVTNLTGTASININGTVGATTASTGAFTTLSATGLATLASSQITGATFPASGSGLELVFQSGISKLQSFNRTGSVYLPMTLDGTTVDILSSGVTKGSFSSTGLAVTGTLSATGTVTSTKDGLLLERAGASNASQYIAVGNTSGQFYFGANGSVANSFFTGGTAFDTNLGVTGGFAVGMNGGAQVARFSSTGLAVTGTLSATQGLSTGLSSGVGYQVNSTVNSVNLAFSSTTTGTSANYISLVNTGGQLFFGIDNNSGNSLGAAVVYGTVLGSPTTFQVQIAGTNRAAFSSTGLAVTGSGAASQTLTINGTTTGANFARFTSTGADGVIGIESSAGSAIMSGSSANATVLYTVGATSLQFGTNSTTRATISSTALALQSGISLTGGTSGTGYSFSGSAPAGSLTLDASGLLGIGTASPATKLQVYGGALTVGNESTYAARFGNNSNKGVTIGYDTTNNVGHIGSINPAVAWTDLVINANGGNLGLGVTPVATWSGYKVLQAGIASFAGGSSGAYLLQDNCYTDNAGTTWKYINSSYAPAQYYAASGAHVWRTAASGTAGDPISFTQAMTLDASGALLIGATSFTATANNNSVQIGVGANTGTVWINHVTGTTTGSRYANFAYAGTEIGSITQSGTTAVLYNLTSDQRLKENIQDAAPASALIDAIQVREYNWKSDGSFQRYGFVAQELVTVAPEAVHQPSDPNEMMAVDYSKLVPLLVKEVQSLRARVAQLESKP